MIKKKKKKKKNYLSPSTKAWFLPAGVLADIFGPRITCMIGSGLLMAGFLLFSFSDPISKLCSPIFFFSPKNKNQTYPPDFDAFIPAFLIIAIAGPSLYISVRVHPFSIGR